MRLGTEGVDKSFGMCYTKSMTPNFKGFIYGKKSTNC